jgi:hypothetical protein
MKTCRRREKKRKRKTELERVREQVAGIDTIDN